MSEVAGAVNSSADITNDEFDTLTALNAEYFANLAAKHSLKPSPDLYAHIDYWKASGLDEDEGDKY